VTSVNRTASAVSVEYSASDFCNAAGGGSVILQNTVIRSLSLSLSLSLFLILTLNFLSRPSQSSNRIARSTTSTVTSEPPNFPTGPAGALDEEANSRAVSVLKQMKEFAVETGDGAGNSGRLFEELVISEPDEFRNRSFTSHLVLLPWSEKLLTQRVEESFYAGKHMVFCRKHDDQLAMVSNDNHYHHSVMFVLELVVI
jgi:hypothetical protein